MTDPINTLPIQQFISSVKSADASNVREVKLDTQSAKRLAFTLGEVLARLNGDLEELLIKKASGDDDKVVVQFGSTEGNWK
jgi:hypothetical protein